MNVVRHHDVLIDHDAIVVTGQVEDASFDNRTATIQMDDTVVDGAEDVASTCSANGDEVRMPGTVGERPETQRLATRHRTIVATQASRVCAETGTNAPWRTGFSAPAIVP